MSKDQPILPQHDTDPKGRNAQLDEARETYQYDYESLPPVAMIYKVPRSERGSLHWTLINAKNAVRVNYNELANREFWKRGSAGTRSAGDSANMPALQAQHQEHKGFFEDFESLVEGGPGAAPTTRGGSGPQSEEDWHDEATQRLGELSPVLRPPADPDEEAGPSGQKTRGTVAQVLKGIGPNGRPRSLSDYDELFNKIDPIPLSSDFRDDTSFGRLAVAGWNPMMIEAVNKLPDHFAVTDEQYRQVMGNADSLARAGAEGRLYLSDYKLIEGLVAGDTDEMPKYTHAPLALYARPADAPMLRPVAIQCNQVPDAKTNPVYTAASDSWHWLIAKTVLSIADANYHELGSHLGRTHLLLQPATMAMHRHLSTRHPLFQLLAPHCEGTLYINNMAANNLIAPGGDIDLIFSGTVESSRLVAAKSLTTYHFRDNMLPQALARRKVADTTALPYYPYRDDGMLLWNAIESWVNAYLTRAYSGSDAEVTNDTELREWARQLATDTPGGLYGFGPINTLSDLIAAVTMFVFTASAQHAVVNFAQWDLMSYAPATTGANWAPMPESGVAVNEQSWLDQLPPLQLAERQLGTLYQLGNCYYTQLGHYKDDAFSDPVVTNQLLPKFRARLAEIEVTINAANHGVNKRPWPFEFMLPSKVPQSINI